MSYPKSIKSKRYPSKIRNSAVFDVWPKPDKVFPRIGLKNNRKKVKFGGKDYTIVFSSSGPKGSWDLATMSMRGIKSCMNWKNDNSDYLVGTLADPYAAIVYLTNGKDTNYGEKMLARCVVRLVCKYDNGVKPNILLEPMYGRGRFQDNPDALDLFSKYIEKRVSIPVIRTGTKNNKDMMQYSGYLIPITEATESVPHAYRTYSDTGIGYNVFPGYYNPKEVKL